MQLNKELFGKKIICNGYLKKIPTKYVYANIRHYDKMNDYPITGDEIFLSEDEEYIEQKTMEVCNCKFKGIIVGIREVSTKNYYEQATRSIYDPDTLGYDDEEFIDGVRVEKQDFVDCYIVYYTNNKKRLVPIDMIQKIEGDKQ